MGASAPSPPPDRAEDVGALAMPVWQRVGNLVGVFLPIAGLAVAVVLLWNRLVGPADLAIAAVLYVLTGLGVTVGFHRLLTHRAFQTTPALRAVFAALGSMSVQGPVIHWVADHRKHHAYTDEQGDPHSPHLARWGGLVGAASGLWHAHMGWLWSRGGRGDPQRYAPDLLQEPAMRFIDRTFVLWVALGLALPAAAGWALGGLPGALTGLVWGGLVRIFLLHHVTFAINSLCHFTGRRRFPTDDESRNVAWLAPLSFGEAWHNNHHAFPTSAFHGLRRRELDPGAWVIRGLAALGLAWQVNAVGRERQAARRLSPPRA